jgi:uncharacterized protein
MLITFFILGGFIYKVTGIGTQITPGLPVDDVKASDIGKLVQLLFSTIVFGLTGYLYARFTFRDRPGYHLGLRPATRSSFYLLAILLLIFAFPLEEWLMAINKQIPLWHWMVSAQKDNDRQVEAFLKVHHPYDPIINVLIMAAVPAFCEEICFRGALQRIMIQITKRPLAGILITSFLFSSFHLQFEGFLPRVFLAVLLGLAYWYSGGLWVPIAAHFFFNASQIIVAMYAPDFMTKNPSIPLLFVFLSFVIVVGLLSLMSGRSTASYAAVYES